MLCSYESRAASPELPVPRPSIIFSTLRPSKETIRELTDGSLLLKLAPGEVSQSSTSDLSTANTK